MARFVPIHFLQGFLPFNFHDFHFFLTIFQPIPQPRLVLIMFYFTQFVELLIIFIQSLVIMTDSRYFNFFQILPLSYHHPFILQVLNLTLVFLPLLMILLIFQLSNRILPFFLLTFIYLRFFLQIFHFPPLSPSLLPHPFKVLLANFKRLIIFIVFHFHLNFHCHQFFQAYFLIFQYFIHFFSFLYSIII